MNTKDILTVENARKIVAPLYDCLNEPSKKDVNAILEKGVNPDYKSYHTNDEFLTRDQLAENGKLATAYHIENWMTALQQIK